MPHVQHGDTPEYAVEIIEAAKPIGPQLATAAGLLTMLLVAMSAIEAPMLSRNSHVDRAGELERPPARELGLLCSLGGKIVNWMAVEAS